MLKARPDRKNPLASSGAMPATMIGSRSADRIRAAVICAANAVHMSAPAEKQHAKKTLATGEPSTHEVERFQRLEPHGEFVEPWAASFSAAR